MEKSQYKKWLLLVTGGSDRLKGLADTLHEKGIGLFVVCIDIDGDTAEKQRLGRNNLRDINMAGA